MIASSTAELSGVLWVLHFTGDLSSKVLLKPAGLEHNAPSHQPVPDRASPMSLSEIASLPPEKSFH